MTRMTSTIEIVCDSFGLEHRYSTIFQHIGIGILSPCYDGVPRFSNKAIFGTTEGIEERKVPCRGRCCRRDIEKLSGWYTQSSKRWIYCNIILYNIYTSEGTKFMLLGSFAKHPFRSTADHIFKSVLCARCGTVNYHPFLNIYIYIRV